MMHISWSNEDGWATPRSICTNVHKDSDMDSVSCISRNSTDILFFDSDRTVNIITINNFAGKPLIALPRALPNVTITPDVPLRLVATSRGIDGHLEMFWLNGQNKNAVRIEGAEWYYETRSWENSVYVPANIPESPSPHTSLEGVCYGDFGLGYRALFYSDTKGRLLALRKKEEGEGNWYIERLSEMHDVASGSSITATVQPYNFMVQPGREVYELEVFWMSSRGEIEHRWCVDGEEFNGVGSRVFGREEPLEKAWIVGCAESREDGSVEKCVFFGGEGSGGVRGMYFAGESLRGEDVSGSDDVVGHVDEYYEG